MIKSVIIDDSPDAIQLLEGLLESYCQEVYIADVATKVDDGISIIKKHRPDLVFLDIEIGDKTGFDLLNSLDDLNFAVIFTTAFNNYAIEAFKFNAVHYILKPIDRTDLIDAVNRVSSKKENTNIAVDNIKSLLRQIENPHSRKVALHTEEGIKYVASDDIIHVKADGSYSLVYVTSGRSFILSKLLKEFEQELDKRIFHRIGKSYIVNLNHVKMYKRTDGGTVEMIDGTQIIIPRRKREDFISAMNRFIG